MIRLNKHLSSDGTYEYISASDIFKTMDENDLKARKAYEFLHLIEQELNYFNKHTSTAFGNPDLSYIHGMVQGYCTAKDWTYSTKDNEIRIKKGRKFLFVIERPCIPSWELDARRELAAAYKSIGL